MHRPEDGALAVRAEVRQLGIEPPGPPSFDGVVDEATDGSGGVDEKVDFPPFVSDDGSG